MGTDLMLVVSLVLSAVAALAAIGGLVRIGLVIAELRRQSTRPESDKAVGPHPDLITRLTDLDKQGDTISQQLDRLERKLAFVQLREPAQGSPTVSLELAPSAAPLNFPVDAVDPPSKVDLIDPPVPENLDSAEDLAVPNAIANTGAFALSDKHDEDLVAGYQAIIAGRSKAPIREWLSKHGGIAVHASEDGNLIPGDGGLIAAIPISADRAILLPTAGFVVDFATQFSGSQISMRQVMWGCFDAVADGSGDMKLQSPGIARRDRDHWVLEQPGQLSGFTDVN